ncbi:unnamed protein product [Coffea canephora]|uniref:Uncharacterized protein n=1 Tax=Coffea canephora TaxID=49390 RepID=A0A068UP67_COFCA|nr:unnamed protein product [Coffea canephora]
MIFNCLVLVAFPYLLLLLLSCIISSRAKLGFLCKQMHNKLLSLDLEMKYQHMQHSLDCRVPIWIQVTVKLHPSLIGTVV